MAGAQPEANLNLLPAMKELSLAAAVVGLCISSSLGTASNDGDPLNNYQFTGDIPIETYVEQGRTRVYRSGLWTVQHFQHLDAFAGETWDLSGNRKERIGVFYGTWPKWASDYSYDSSIHSRSFREEGSPSAEFELVRDTFGSSEPDPGLLAVDYTASGAITLWIEQWNGGANSGSSSMILRLSGSDAASSKVEVLWEGQDGTLEDLDGDGEPEIIDTDWTHRYASYLPHKGVSTRAVLDWDPELDRYRAVGGDLYRRAIATLRDESPGELSRSAWIQQQRSSVRECWAEWGELDQERVQLVLASSLSDLLWSGEAREARAIFDEFPLPSYYGGTDTEWTAETWWLNYVAGCQRSKYWPDLCAAYPALLDL